MINSYFFYKEIKNRCFIILLLWLFNAIVCLCNKENILFFLLQSVEVGSTSMNETYFVFTDLPEVFSVFIESTLFFTNQLSVLLLLHQSTIFFSTSFRPVELNTIKRALKFFAAGWAITLLLFKLAALPSMLAFFLAFPNDYNTLSPHPLLFEAKLDQFLSFCLSTYTTCLVIVELCVFGLFSIMFDTLTINAQKNRKIFYLIVVIVSSVIAPFEVLSQWFLVVFILFYWEFVIFVSILFTRT